MQRNCDPMLNGVSMACRRISMGLAPSRRVSGRYGSIALLTCHSAHTMAQMERYSLSSQSDKPLFGRLVCLLSHFFPSLSLSLQLTSNGPQSNLKARRSSHPSIYQGRLTAVGTAAIRLISRLLPQNALSLPKVLPGSPSTSSPLTNRHTCTSFYDVPVSQ